MNNTKYNNNDNNDSTISNNDDDNNNNNKLRYMQDTPDGWTRVSQEAHAVALAS